MSGLIESRDICYHASISQLASRSDEVKRTSRARGEAHMDRARTHEEEEEEEEEEDDDDEQPGDEPRGAAIHAGGDGELLHAH